MKMNVGDGQVVEAETSEMKAQRSKKEDQYLSMIERKSTEEQQQNLGKLDLMTSRMTEKKERLFFAREGVDPLTHAFDKKSAVHAGLGGAPVERSRTAAIWSDLMAKSRDRKTTLYLHIPFCRKHCLYCGFYLNPVSSMSSEIYTDALIREMMMGMGKAAVSDYPIHSVYLGGGTPTVLDPSDLKRLLKAIRSHFPLANDCEITVESTVSDLDEEILSAALEGGANRFSIGVQSFDTDIRKSLGRTCDVDAVMKTLTRVRDTDDAVVVIDLIYGLPGQTLSVWEKDIETFTSLELDGVDLYQLNTFTGSPLEKALNAGRLPAAAAIPEQARMFERGVKMMQKARYRRLSMSHWGRTTRERNLYNLLIKEGAPCFPLGSGAGGSLHGYGCFSLNKLEPYLTAIDAGSKPLAVLMAYPNEKRMNDSITGGLEVGHLNFAAVKKKHGFDLARVCAPLLSQWERVGLIERDGDWISLTIAGQFWQVNLAQALIDYCQKKE